jgi:RHS repeat-associated protein
LLLSPFFFLIIFRYTKSTRKSLVILLGFLGGVAVLGFLVLPRGAKAQESGEKIYYYHNDHLGSPIKLTDQAQNVVWSWQYGPFGEEPLTMNTNTISQNLRFPGQYYDSETGLNYNFHRYYSSKLGRYLTPDPLKKYSRYPQPYNTYAYAVNNPVKSKDPFGLASVTNNMPYPVQGSGNPGLGFGSGGQITFWIQPGQTVNWENPKKVNGQLIYDVDFVNPKGGPVNNKNDDSPDRIHGDDVWWQYDINPNPNANAKTCSEGQSTRNRNQTLLNLSYYFNDVAESQYVYGNW